MDRRDQLFKNLRQTTAAVELGTIDVALAKLPLALRALDRGASTGSPPRVGFWINLGPQRFD